MAKNKNTTGKEKFTTMDMPEVSDIPGQENIKPPHINEMVDATASSDGEEGKGILDDLNKEEEDVELDDSTNVTPEEKKLLLQSDRPVTDEDIDLQKLKLDNLDDDDEPLNESADPEDLGNDLDVPGAELDDDDEETGEEDEENNNYSLPD
jgi:hypothetical protein